MTVLFISDLHLEDTRPDLNRAFLSFSRHHAEKAEALYILGDLFNAWIGDDENSATGHLVAHELGRLSKKGVKIFLQHGNRDFLLGERFAKVCGATLLPDACVITPFEKPLLLMHGDQLCTEDHEYQDFREQVRNPSWQQQFLAKPLAERQKIAMELRNKSREANRVKAEDIMDVSPSAVDAALDKYSVDLLIHGHTHRPSIHPINEHKTRIVLGDWDQDVWYLQLEADNSFELKHYPLTSLTSNPSI